MTKKRGKMRENTWGKTKQEEEKKEERPKRGGKCGGVRKDRR